MKNEELLSKINELENRVTMLERSALAQRIDFTPRPLTATEEQARNLGVPAYIIEIIPLYKALEFITTQYKKGHLRVVGSTAERRIPLGKIEQLMAQFGGEYRQRATIAQLRTITDVPLMTYSGRVQVADFNLARLRSVEKHGIYQVRYHTRNIAMEDIQLAVTKLKEIFATVPQIDKDMLALDKRMHELTWEKELTEITKEIMNSESRKTSRFIKKDATLNITCSPQARESVLPTWSIPSDITIVAEEKTEADTSGIESQEEQLELDTGDVAQWWLDKGVELNEELMPMAASLYPNPREVMRKAGDSISAMETNIDTGRTYAEDALILTMVGNGQLADALPHGESFNDIPDID